MDNFDMNLMLEPVLANVVKSLADFFGTTTEAVMANAPTFLAEYGWYHVLTMMPLYIIVALILGVGGGFIIASFFEKGRVPVFIFIMLLAFAIVFGAAFLPVIISPELVGLDHLIYVITGKNVI
jgi:hypothetical protein